MTIVANDAQLGLYSDPVGSVGSGIQLGEVTDGSLTDKWAIFRGTSGLKSDLRISFGSNTSFSLNEDKVVIDTSGTLQARRFGYIEPVLEAVSVGPEAFVPVRGGVWDPELGFMFSAGVGGVNVAYAAIQLPHGAEIKKLRCYVLDNVIDEDLRCQLWKVPERYNEATLIRSILTNGAPGWDSIETSDANEIVDNFSFS